MKKYLPIFSLFTVVLLALGGCKKEYPIDEDGLLITTRGECFVSDFDILGADQQTVRASNPVIDTTACTVNVQVFFGTDLKNVYPVFTLASDCKLDPKITGKTDFSDLANPRSYTVVSGNRKVKKAYKIFVTVKQ